MVETDQTARLKMLAVIALAESEDGRWNPNDVKPHLGHISTEDLQKALAATQYCIIELHIVRELGTREDITAKKLMELTSATKHVAVQQALCEAAATLQMEKSEPPSMETIKGLYTFGVATPTIKQVIQHALCGVSKGELPKFIGQDIDYLIIDEFKRRNDPIGERLLQLLDMDLAKSTQEAVVAMIRHDRRITPDHLFTVHNHAMVGWVLHEKLKGASLEEKRAWYKDGQEAARMAIIASCEDDLRKLSDVTETTAFLIDHAGSPAIHATIVRTLGKYIPIRQLLELREQTTDATVVSTFKTLFGERYHELQKFLASP